MALSGALSSLSTSQAWADGSIHNHLTLDLLPIAQSINNPAGSAIAISYDRTHDAFKSAYSLSLEACSGYRSDSRVDVNISAGLFTEVIKGFSVGGRVGVVVNNPATPSGFGALAIRLPALSPDEKGFMSFFFEELDLGLAGAGDRYAGFRLGMTLF